MSDTLTAAPDLRARLAAEPGVVIESFAADNGVTCRDVVEAMPAAMIRFVKDDFASTAAFVAVMGEVATWGDVTFIVHSEDGIFEFGGPIPPGSEAHGTRIASLPMVWLGGKGMAKPAAGDPIPLVLFDHPCLFRQAAFRTLEGKGLRWRLSLTTPSLSGVWAALRSGHGISVRTAHRVPAGIGDVGVALGLPKDEGKAIIDRYYERFPGIRAFSHATLAFAREHGFTRTLFGRKTHFEPNIRSPNPSIRGGAERAAINAPIQGTSADLIKRAMARMDGALAEAGLGDVKMLLQVHDELVFEVPEGQEEDAAAVIKRVMANAAEPAIALDVPLDVEVGWGAHWGEAH